MEKYTFDELHVSQKVKDKLAGLGVVRHFREGEIILNENAHIRSMPIVKKGSVRVMRTEHDGREILLYYIKAGESCIMSFLGGLHQDTSRQSWIQDRSPITAHPE